MRVPSAVRAVTVPLPLSGLDALPGSPEGAAPRRPSAGTAGGAREGANKIAWEVIRDRDGAFGEVFIRRVRSMGIRDRPTSPRSPWQNGYAERLIRTIKEEEVDLLIGA